MCIVLAIIALLLVFYGSAQLQEATLNVQSIVVAQGWEILQVFWPFLAAAFFIGVLFVLLILKFNKPKP